MTLNLYLLLVSVETFAQPGQDKVHAVLSDLNDSAYALYNRNPRVAISISFDVLSAYAGSAAIHAAAYKNIGLSYWRLSLYDSSLYFYELGKTITDSLSDALASSKIMNNMALVYRDRGQYSMSLSYYLEAFEIQKGFGDHRSLAITMVNLAVISYRMGYQEKALDYLSQSINLAESEGIEIAECIACSVSIELLPEQEEIKTYFERAKDRCRSIGNKYYEGLAIFNYGVRLSKKSQFPEAIENLNAALTLFREVGDRRKVCATLNALGMAHFGFDHSKSAMQYFENARDQALEFGFSEELVKSYEYISRIYEREGDFHAALQVHEKHHQLSDSLKSLEKAYAINELSIKYESRQKEIENEVLRAEKALQGQVIARQKLTSRIYLLIILISILIIGGLAFAIVFARRNISSLRSLNMKIEMQSKELHDANKEVVRRNRELNGTIEKLTKTQKQLIDSEKLAMLGSLSAGVGHEINNPLNFIKGGIDALSAHLKPYRKKSDQEMDRYLRIVNEGVDRASSIVKSLSHFSRMGSNQEEVCDIHGIIDNCLVILETRLKHRIEVIKNFEAEPSTCLGNGGRLHQAFMNLLSNAEQSILGEGIITISTAIEKNVLQVIIGDSGQGISKKHLSSVMNPFFTTKEPGKGTGLGLSITYSIIEEHQGKISVASEIGKGTTFTVHLPLSATSVERMDA